MNENLISVVKLQQRGMSVALGKTIAKFKDGAEMEISECMEDNGGYIHHLDWCKGECNL
jgi:hypothetical protein